MFNNDQVSLLNSFYDFLLEENKKYNLTSILDEESFWKKHVFDSSQAVSFISQNSSICDIGSGAGFPSIPLAILLPSCSFSLVDSVNKKTTFIKQASSLMSLFNISVFHSRVEDFALKYRESFDYTLARAVAPLNTLLEYAIPLLKVGGFFISYKTSDYKDELSLAKNALVTLGSKLDQVFDYSFSINGDIFKRSLLIFKKIKKTPSLYPRSKNLPRKFPIV